VLRFFIIVTLLLVSLEANSEKEGLAYLNNIREHAGLIKLKTNKALQRAAVSHAKYLIQNQRNGHYEKKGKYSYTGTTPSKRVIKAGYPSTFVMENLSINTAGQAKSIDNLFSAIYHRLVFLNLDKDEIGFGFYSTKKKRKIKRAYVYDEEKKDEVRRKNKDIILYPYAEQTNIWPAFYNESPDPLPGYKVSGFPISVQFNPAYYKSVKLKSFRLYDEYEKEIKKTKILQHKNDHNHLLTNLEFALMPLKRLEFGRTYTVVFDAVADGVQVKKRWSFTTVKLKEKLYRITEKKTKLTVPSGSTALLYIVPDSGKDIVHSYKSRGGVKAFFLDQNTLKVTFPKRRSSGRVSLDFGKKKVFFDVQ